MTKRAINQLYIKIGKKLFNLKKELFKIVSKKGNKKRQINQ